MDSRELRVKDLMQTDVKKVTKDTTLAAAAKIMHESGVSSLVVEPENDSDTFGIVTRKDMVDALMETSIGGASKLVADAMTKPVITVGTNLSIYHCQQMMRMIGARRLPVVEGTALVGILSNSDIFAKLVENLD